MSNDKFEFESSEGVLTEQVQAECEKQCVGGLSKGLVDFDSDINSKENEDKDSGFMSDRQFEKFKSMYVESVNKTFGTNFSKGNINQFSEAYNKKVDEKSKELLKSKKDDANKRMEEVCKQLGIANPNDTKDDIEFK